METSTQQTPFSWKLLSYTRSGKIPNSSTRSPAHDLPVISSDALLLTNRSFVGTWQFCETRHEGLKGKIGCLESNERFVLAQESLTHSLPGQSKILSFNGFESRWLSIVLMVMRRRRRRRRRRRISQHHRPKFNVSESNCKL